MLSIDMRMTLAALSSFALVWLGLPYIINLLQRHKLGQHIQADGPKHMQKAHTPTMGGVFLVLVISIVSICFSEASQPIFWLSLLLLWGYTAIGAVDDISKWLHANNDHGLTPRQKLLAQVTLALLAYLGWVWCFNASAYTQLHLPITQDWAIQLDLGLAYLVFALMVIVGSSNAVNLTDGLDGLVSIPLILVCIGLGLEIFLREVGHVLYATDLGPWQFAAYASSIPEMAVLLAAIIGTLAAFLWYNCHPAAIFMGDAGSLGLGGLVGFLAVVLKCELVFAVMAGLFIVETMSVIIQVLYYKRTKKRVFKMAPLHHHYELSGWKEQQVVTRFWLVSMLFLLVSCVFMG